jgi:hypothetical protein
LGKDLGVKWFVKINKFFKSSTLYEQYGSFLKGTSTIGKEENKEKPKSKRQRKHTKHKK